MSLFSSIKLWWHNAIATVAAPEVVQEGDGWDRLGPFPVEVNEKLRLLSDWPEGVHNTDELVCGGFEYQAVNGTDYDQMLTLATQTKQLVKLMASRPFTEKPATFYFLEPLHLRAKDFPLRACAKQAGTEITLLLRRKA